MSVSPGTRLGPYEITGKLGEGGMGEVYRATDPKLRREVAIKVLPEAFAADADRLARFERKAQVRGAPGPCGPVSVPFPRSPSRALLEVLLKKTLTAALLLTLGSRPAPAMDKVRVESNIDAAVAKYGLTGKGVIVALLDRGIDWKNADFRNPDGTTRIAAVFDLTDDAGAATSGYGKGTIYTRAQIDAALSGGPTIPFRDAVGHGTTTSGIPAGNGRNVAKYRGVAPEATIISVKVTSDGAPAHDGEAAEAAFYDPARLPLAIDFVKAKAQELGLPAVMLLNLGSSGGPTDGTSDLARKIDATVGPGIPGLVFVTGPGDDGGMANRAGGNVGAGATETIRIQKGGTGTLTFDLWYPGTDRFDVTIQTPTATYGPYVSPASNADAATVTTSEFLYYQLGSSRAFWSPQNGKREVWIRITGAPGVYTVSLRGATVTTGRFDATLNPSMKFNASNANFFLDHVAPGSIWDGATARNNICPGDYVIRTSYVDIDGFQRTITGQGSIGEIWPGSSVGPTFDGRLGVDVTAPGDSLFTVYNPKSYWATARHNMIQDGGGLYGRASAVSAAAPIVTGIIALMLQANPTLDAPTVKAILQRTARADSFTGAVPNTTWGYGKVDALAALDAVTSTTLFVPVALSSSGASGSFYTTELALTNRGSTDATITYAYTAAFGGSSGTATETLGAGRQKTYADTITSLRALGIPLGDSGNRGGTLQVTFGGLSSPAAAAATVRTATPVADGRAGLAYAGLPSARLLSSPVWLCGLRQNATDRSNVAVQHAGGPSDGNVTLRLTVVSGDPANPGSLALPDVTLTPGGFSQISGILASNGLSFSNGFVKVERVSGSAPFNAYGVINDQANSDGSFVEPVPANPAAAIAGATLPVVVETSAFSTELVLTNFSGASRTLQCTYVAAPLPGGQITFDLPLFPNEQQILPAFVQVLRSRGFISGGPGATFAGALFVRDATGDLRGVSIGARTSSVGGGGRYGLFYSAVPYGAEATTAAWLYGLQQNADNRTNLALVNVGSADASTDTFHIDLYDGATGQKAGETDATVPAKGFFQIGAILGAYAPGVTSGYAKVTRTSGNNPFVAYAVINDGGQPNQRSGDGAFVSAVVGP
ncbi:MAG: S8 family serine peptidase [Holophagales bacterium]|nr:S8 family serine peptidase [Holophagales bacterium]